MKKILYGKAVYDKKEINAVVNVLKNESLTLIDGKNVKKLEKKITRIFGKKYGLMVNSGSSANLLALSSCNFKKGSEIITPTLTFSTTVAPIYQLGLIPSFIGVIDNMYVADTDQIEERINHKTVALMIPNLLGNIANWKKINSIAKKYDLKVIEDSADTIGYSINNKNTGNLSDIVTNSFYASHIINGAGFGGIACFNDFKLYNKAKLLRGWGRSSATFNESENIKKRFNIKIAGINYDAKYIFSDLGYNFLPSEISAAFALIQIKNLRKNLKNRLENYNYLKKNLSVSDNFFIPLSYENVETGWLAFPIILQNKLASKRREVQIFLEKAGIQTRTIFTGNILRQPVAKKFKWESYGNFSVSDNIMKSGILLGCHNKQTKDKMDYTLQKLFEAENCLI